MSYYSGCLDSHKPHFLEACFLCRKTLGRNSDIYMYRLVFIIPLPSLLWVLEIVRRIASCKIICELFLHHMGSNRKELYYMYG